MLRPFTDGLSGVERGRLDRFYENNTFYRKPRIIDAARGKGNILNNNLSLSLIPKGKQWKAELPEPYTFASLCENIHYGDLTDLIGDLSDIISLEARAMDSKGCSILQFNGPSLTSLKDDSDSMDQARAAFRRVTKGLSAKTYLYVYLDDISPIFESLLDFGADGLGIDFTTSDLTSLKGRGSPRALICGCVDGRNTRVESPTEIREFATKVSEILEVSNISISTSCDLEFVPSTFAKRKVSNLGRAINTTGG